jgi:acetyl-CoA synthetase
MTGHSSPALLAARSRRAADAAWSWEAAWSLFAGDDEHLNIAVECLDRHDPERIAARISLPDGSIDEPTFGELSRSTAQFAHLLAARGVGEGEPVGVMLEPGRAFYAALFGVIKRGAVAVPLYTPFGPDAIRDRLDDCGATVLVAGDAALAAAQQTSCEVLAFDQELEAQLAAQPSSYAAHTAARDAAVLQYTSGTTRQLAEAVPHDHRAIVTLARAGLFALGLEAGDRYFCPSSPSWGHGLWHGTIAPWSLGIALGAYAGRFDVDRLVDTIRDLKITNLAAASTVYRMLISSGRLGELPNLKKASYTGEHLEPSAQDAFLEATGVVVCGMYGTTETGVILANYPGFEGFLPRLGALGVPVPGCEVQVRDADGPAAPGVVAEIMLRRRGAWTGTKDLGVVDDEGHIFYRGRADDVIISAGWTISPLEIERTLLLHPAVAEAAVVGVPDELRGNVVCAYVVAPGAGDGTAGELQQLVRDRLSPHEYPRAVFFVSELPKTPNGKIDRRALRAV